MENNNPIKNKIKRPKKILKVIKSEILSQFDAVKETSLNVNDLRKIVFADSTNYK